MSHSTDALAILNAKVCAGGIVRQVKWGRTGIGTSTLTIEWVASMNGRLESRDVLYNVTPDELDAIKKILGRPQLSLIQVYYS